MNAISPTFANKLDLWIWQTKIDTQKIDGSSFEIFGIVIASFLMNNIVGKSRFLKEIFLLANISIDIALKMPILILNNAKINILEPELS